MSLSESLVPLLVPERTIPVPGSISPEAQAVLSRAAQTPMSWPSYPDLGDNAAWIEWSAAADRNMKAMFDAGGNQLAGAEVDIFYPGSAPCYRIIDKSLSVQAANNIVFEIHGGGLIAGGGDLCKRAAAVVSSELGALVYAPDYRMPPLHPFPAALDDCVAAYRDLLVHHAPERIVLHGSSAGGNLAAALLLRARDEGLALPAGVILETPELDLTESGDSFHCNMWIDVVLQRGLGSINQLYAGSHDLAHPYLSPLFGDFSTGWPPTLLTAGTRDLFLSNAVRMLHQLRKARVPVELLVYEAMPHGGFFGTPDDAAVKADLRQFAERCWRI